MILYILLAGLALVVGLALACFVRYAREEAELLDMRRKDAAAQRERINRSIVRWAESRETGERIERTECDG